MRLLSASTIITTVDYYGVNLPMSELQGLFDSGVLPPQPLHCYQLASNPLVSNRICFNTKLELDRYVSPQPKSYCYSPTVCFATRMEFQHYVKQHQAVINRLKR